MLLDRLRALRGKDPAAVVHAVGIGSQETSRMSRAYFQIRKFVERSLENHVRKKHGRFQGISDHIAEHAASLHAVANAGGVGAILRVNEDQRLQFLGLGPEGIELRIGQLFSFAVRADGDAAQTMILDALFHLLRREFRELQAPPKQRPRNDPAAPRTRRPAFHFADRPAGWPDRGRRNTRMS